MLHSLKIGGYIWRMLQSVVSEGYFKIRLFPYGKVDFVTQEFALSTFPLGDETLYTIYFHSTGITESITKGVLGFHSYSRGAVQSGHDLHVDKYLKCVDRVDFKPNSIFGTVIQCNKLLLSLEPFDGFDFVEGSRDIANWYPMYFAFHFPGFIVTKTQFANVKTYSGDNYEIFQEIENISFVQEKYIIDPDLRGRFDGFNR